MGKSSYCMVASQSAIQHTFFALAASSMALSQKQVSQTLCLPSPLAMQTIMITFACSSKASIWKEKELFLFPNS